MSQVEELEELHWTEACPACGERLVPEADTCGACEVRVHEPDSGDLLWHLDLPLHATRGQGEG